MNRRDWMRDAAAPVLGFAGLLLWFRAHAGIGREGPATASPALDRRGLVRPPGALAEEEFLARCIRCQRCGEACESGAIRLIGADGGNRAGTPRIVPELRGCDLCLACGPACPVGALVVLDDVRKVRMGTAVVDERLCVSHNGTGICGACFTVCPLRGHAITQGLHNRPVVHPDACVGCGLCEEACIVKGDRAIRVFNPGRRACA